MRLNPLQAELFAAFSGITAKVFSGNRLLSCPTLSKAPNYGNVLLRFMLRQPIAAPGLKTCLRIGLRYTFSNGAHFLFMLLSAAYIRILGWKCPKEALLDPENPLLLIDSFAVLPRIEKEGRYRELYLSGLAEEAQAAGHNVACLYRLYGSRDPRVLWRAFKVLAAHAGMTEAHLFTLSDWFRLLWHAISYPFALARLIRSLRAYPAHSPQAYIRDALIQTAGQCILIGEARRLAGRRLGLLLAARPFARPSSEKARPTPQGRSTHLVTWYENQTVNKCLMRGLAEAEKSTGRHVPVTGAQLSLWPTALLNNLPDDGEAVLGLVPDRVLVNGPHFLPEHTRQRYAVGPSLRYAALFEEVKDTGESSVQSGPMPLLALLSYYPEEVKRVLQMLLPLADDGVEVIYKFHPTANPEQFDAWLPASPIIADGPLKDALDDIRRRGGAVLGSVSGALVEAVVAGIPVLSVEEQYPELGMNYLPEYGRGVLWESVTGADEVRDALAALGRHVASPGRAEVVRELRELLFTEPTQERIRRDFCL